MIGVICFFFGETVQKQKNPEKIIVDFKSKEGQITEYSSNFISPVGLHYLYLEETKNINNYRSYFDTLTYFRKNLVYFNMSDTNYLLIFKPDVTNRLDGRIYGFTRNKFYRYEPKEILLRNFPASSSKRGSSECIVSDSGPF
jgi:hypothetical protein